MSDSGLMHGFFTQFEHHPWHGLRFWDLIQPAFMFIVGVAMAYSLNKRFNRGDTYGMAFKHICIRCLWLLAFGTGLHCIWAGELVWILRNVLAQMSATILIAFLIIRLPWKIQLVISVGLILMTDIVYRLFPLEGYNMPYTAGQNFGTFMDVVLRNPISSGHWVAINCIPTAAHTIWGVLVGKLLLNSERSGIYKAKVLLATGLIGLFLGYLMNWGFGSEILRIPIIKRICTGSFIYASGGWCLLILAAFYTLIDVQNRKPKWLFVINVVGTNSIFIYLVSHTLTDTWLEPNIGIFTNGFLGSIGFGESWIHLITALVCWFILWFLCFWLYKRKIFLRI